MADVVHNPDQHRFEIVEDGGTSELVYRRHDGQLVIVHTGVPEQFEGHGYASQLVEAALQMARDEHLSVRPDCPYAKSWIEKHPDEVSDLTIDPVG